MAVQIISLKAKFKEWLNFGMDIWVHTKTHTNLKLILENKPKYE